MRVYHSHNGYLLDDGSATTTHYEFNPSCCFPSLWHLRHGRCLHGVYEGRPIHFDFPNFFRFFMLLIMTWFIINSIKYEI
jgi:hypothetical protein